MALVKLNVAWVVVTETRELCVMPSRLFSTSMTHEVTADCSPQLAKNHGALAWASLWNTFQQLRRVQVPLAVLKVWSLLVNEVGKEELSSARKREWCQGALNQPWMKLVCLFLFCKLFTSFCSLDENWCILLMQLRFQHGFSSTALER